MAQNLPLAHEIDEMIQQNEILMKENDFLQSFIARYEEDGEVLSAIVPQEPQELVAPDKLLIALSEAQQMKNMHDQLQNQTIDTTVQLKSMIISREQKLSSLRRLMFTFQREVLGETTISSNQEVDEMGMEKIIHHLPKAVNANALQAFYVTQQKKLSHSIEESQRTINKLQRDLQQTSKQVKDASITTGNQLNQVDFDQLKIEHTKLRDKIATRNQELLRIKLSAGNCMLLMNRLKEELAAITEEKKRVDGEMHAKRQVIAELNDKIVLADKDYEVDSNALHLLRTKEISAVDGPYSVDYLSLKVVQQTLEKALKEVERKIQIKQRELENMGRGLDFSAY